MHMHIIHAHYAHPMHTQSVMTMHTVNVTCFLTMHIMIRDSESDINQLNRIYQESEIPMRQGAVRRSRARFRASGTSGGGGTVTLLRTAAGGGTFTPAGGGTFNVSIWS